MNELLRVLPAHYALPLACMLCVAGWRTKRSRAFDEHHVEIAGAQPLLTSSLVFGRVVECLGTFGRRKFDHDKTVAVELSLQNRSRASAHDELAAVLSDGR